MISNCIHILSKLLLVAILANTSIVHAEVSESQIQELIQRIRYNSDESYDEICNQFPQEGLPVLIKKIDDLFKNNGRFPKDYFLFLCTYMMLKEGSLDDVSKDLLIKSIIRYAKMAEPKAYKDDWRKWNDHAESLEYIKNPQIIQLRRDLLEMAELDRAKHQNILNPTPTPKTNLSSTSTPPASSDNWLWISGLLVLATLSAILFLKYKTKNKG